MALKLRVSGVFTQAFGCDCALRSRILPLLVSGLVLRGAVVGIPELDGLISRPMVFSRGYPFGGSSSNL